MAGEGAAPTLYVRKSSGLIRAISARDALISNIVGMGILVNLFWVVYASALYPNADLPSTVFIGLLLTYSSRPFASLLSPLTLA